MNGDVVGGVAGGAVSHLRHLSDVTLACNQADTIPCGSTIRQTGRVLFML